MGVFGVIVYRRVIHLVGNQHRESYRTRASGQVHSPGPVCRRKYQLKLSTPDRCTTRYHGAYGISEIFDKHGATSLLSEIHVISELAEKMDNF